MSTPIVAPPPSVPDEARVDGGDNEPKEQQHQTFASDLQERFNQYGKNHSNSLESLLSIERLLEETVLLRSDKQPAAKQKIVPPVTVSSEQANLSSKRSPFRELAPAPPLVFHSSSSSTNLQPPSSSQLLSSSSSSPQPEELEEVNGERHAILFGEIDELDARKKSGRRRKPSPSNPLFVDPKTDQEYLIGTQNSRQITEYCTQMDETEVQESKFGEILDLHSAPSLEKVLEGLSSDSSDTDSGEELGESGTTKKLTNRKQGFPGQILPSSTSVKVCPSDFLFFFTSKDPNANESVMTEGPLTQLAYKTHPFSNEPFSSFVEPPTKRRRVGGSSSSSSVDPPASDEKDFPSLCSKKKMEESFLGELPSDGQERAQYYSEMADPGTVYEESSHILISSFVVVNPCPVSDEDESVEDDSKGGKGKRDRGKKKGDQRKKPHVQKWSLALKRDVTKAAKYISSLLATRMSLAKKIALCCEKEVLRKRREASRVQIREAVTRSKKMAKEVNQYWRRVEKEKRDAQKIAEKKEIERMKLEEEMREAKRQQKKLNFLLTQTELFGHFISRKIQPSEPEKVAETGEDGEEVGKEKTEEEMRMIVVPEGAHLTTEELEENKALCEAAKQKSSAALEKHLASISSFDQRFEEQRQSNIEDVETGQKQEKKKSRGPKAEVSISGGFDASEIEADAMAIEAPRMFQGKLREYQLKGLRWLVNVYNNGINGILADEMGLGKTIQSMALLGHLAEEKGIWGPFLVICPKSTLPNWKQEFEKFLPKFKVIPYWGSQNDRKVLRAFWNPKHLYTPDASCHVLITSYGFAVKDVKHLQRIKWQYMVLDEAQALKSASSQRWKTLLSYNSRNRLLLTGTPIQNNMAELWALLHFIMPTIFDSHDEFNEWFSKDIESHAENQSASLSDHQLSRLHSILKPFMLRRVKSDVENELAPKTEIELRCELSSRQKRLYQHVRRNVSLAEIGMLQKSIEKGKGKPSDLQMGRLMNIVMQFRKVCNHPDIFEKNDVRSPFAFAPLHTDASSIWENPITFFLPTLLYREGGVSEEKNCECCLASLRSSTTLLETPLNSFIRQKILRSMSIFSPDYIAASLSSSEKDLESSEISSPSSFPSLSRRPRSSCFSFLPFMGTSVMEIAEAARPCVLTWWFNWLRAQQIRENLALVFEENGFMIPTPKREEEEMSSDLFTSAQYRRSPFLICDWNRCRLQKFTASPGDSAIRLRSISTIRREKPFSFESMYTSSVVSVPAPSALSEPAPPEQAPPEPAPSGQAPSDHALLIPSSSSSETLANPSGQSSSQPMEMGALVSEEGEEKRVDEKRKLFGNSIEEGFVKNHHTISFLRHFYCPRVLSPPISITSSVRGMLTQSKHVKQSPAYRTALFGFSSLMKQGTIEDEDVPVGGGETFFDGELEASGSASRPRSLSRGRRGQAAEAVVEKKIERRFIIKNREDWHSVRFGFGQSDHCLVCSGESLDSDDQCCCRRLDIGVGVYSNPVQFVKSELAFLRQREGMAISFSEDVPVTVPSMHNLISDCGKLQMFDNLLKKLKPEGHRLLVYSQMTKMLTILEDYLLFRKYSYVRLDGSTSLEDRAQMVNSYQKDDSIFVFLLSTRAGGLGINLTAADTVIFYDSDWNPTIDAQAMDRAHRLGQTRPVTVYRLVTKGTVEERILQRAKQKNTMQNIVIAGGVGKQVDDASSGEPGASDVMSLLLGDDELEQQIAKQQSERSSKRKRGGGGEGGSRNKRIKSFF